MKRVFLASPYRGGFLERWRNFSYGRAALRDSLMRGEAPIGFHLLYTLPGVLRDHNGPERRMGVEAGRAWIAGADAVVVYADHGISVGMDEDIIAAHQVGTKVEYRYLDPTHAENAFDVRGYSEALDRYSGDRL